MIEPTLSLDDASNRTWDAVVVGAGPAGAMAARELVRKGANVLLVERSRFPRYKVCGGCLNPRSLSLLKKSGLGKLTDELGAIPLSKLRLGARGSVADVHLPRGAGVSREAFDTALVYAAIAAGCAFMPGTSGTLLPPDGKPIRQLRLRNANRDYTIASKVVLAAGGLGSKLDAYPEHAERAWEEGSRIGAGAMIPAGTPGYEVGTIYMACAHAGYVGQVVVEDGRIDAAAALDPVAVRSAGGIGELAANILEQAGFPPHPDLALLPWKGTPHLTRQAPRLGGERLFTLGDAAGYIEPFTGEGMAWAFAGAAAVAPLALQTIRDGWDESLLTRWQATYRREVTKRQGVCRLTAGLLRRPITTQVLVRTLGIAPWISRPFLSFMYRA